LYQSTVCRPWGRSPMALLTSPHRATCESLLKSAPPHGSLHPESAQEVPEPPTDHFAAPTGATPGSPRVAFRVFYLSPPSAGGAGMSVWPLG
jgi:hypothetical protein